MVSKALASLDAWLELAERVLAEQREEGLPAGEDLRLLPAAEPSKGRDR